MPTTILGQVLEVIAHRAPDLEVVGYGPRIGDPGPETTEKIDVVILNMTENDVPEVCKSAFRDSARVVIGLIKDGTSAAIHLNDIGAGQLVETIRTICRHS